MLKLVDKDLWFDNEKLFIVRGQANKKIYEKNYDAYPECNQKQSNKSSNNSFNPKLIYMSSLACNLKCKYCYAEGGAYGKEHRERFFTYENYVKTYKYFFEKYGGIHSINFFGGEPLLNFNVIKRFVEYIYQSYDKKCIHQISFGTNLTIMTPEIKEFIKKYNINIGTSLDGPKSLNDSVRIGNVDSVFDEVVKNLNYLSDVNVHKAMQITISKKHIENYHRGDIIKWINEIERLPINRYAIICVFSDNDNLKIDLDNLTIKNNYIQLCEDYADYSFNILKENNHHKPISVFATSTLLKIIKREKEPECGAGESFSITPDLKIYPCHMFADLPEFGVDFNNKLDFTIELNHYFIQTRNANRDAINRCNNCISKNLCSHWCKGCSYKSTQTFNSVVNDRCILEQTFTNKAIKFLVSDYKKYKDIIDKNIYYYQQC